jgi:hypothetical protein
MQRGSRFGCLVGGAIIFNRKRDYLGGITLVGASGIAALLAPEGAPVEYVGAAEGAGLIEVGGALSTLGDTLTGYAQNGVLGAAEAAIVDKALDTVSNNLAGGLEDETDKTTLAALIGNVIDALRGEKAACGGG